MSDSIGGWDPEALSSTAEEHVGIGLDADVLGPNRFLRGVVRLIRRRLAMPDAIELEPGLAVFLLEPTPPQTIRANRIPMLDNGLTAVSGRLWFLGAAVNSGRYLDLPSCTDDELFNYICDDLSLGDAVGAVFDSRTGIAELRFYPVGLQAYDKCHLIELGDAEVRMEDVLEVVDRVHKGCLVTPEAQVSAGNLWVKASKWWAAQNAEEVVQLQLKVALNERYRTCDIRHEQFSVTGRSDLEIEERNPGDRSRVTRHAILELKVLRAYGSGGSKISESRTKEWVRKGLEQAYAYREDKEAKRSALFCFDMREVKTGQECFDHVQADAERMKVTIRAWHIYARSKDYREDLAKSA